MVDKQQRMQELVQDLNEARQNHSIGQPILSDQEYNQMMLELVGLEFELGFKLDESPTQMDGFIESAEMLRELSGGKGEDDE